MTHVQIIDGDFAITDPTWPRIHPWRRGHVYTSDDFSVDGDPVGRMTNAALGGQPVPWVGNAGTWLASGGTVATPANTGSIFLDLPGADVEVSATVGELPKTSQVLLTARRSSISFSPSLLQLRVDIRTSNGLLIRESNGTSTNVIASTSGVDVKPGDRVALRAQGTSVSVVLNGEVVATDSTVVTAPGLGGLSVAGAGTATTVDDLIVTAL